MAIVDVTKEFGGVQGEPAVDASSIDRNKVYGTIYVNINPLVSDWIPKEDFFREATADPMLGLTEDHGYIIRYRFKKRAQVSMHQGIELSETQAQQVEANLQHPLPRYWAFDKHVEELTRTDGPERRLKLQRTYEQQKDEDQATMFRSFGEMIKELTAQIKGGQGLQPSAPESVVVVDSLKRLLAQNPDQFNALIENVKSQTEDEQDIRREIKESVDQKSQQNQPKFGNKR